MTFKQSILKCRYRHRPATAAVLEMGKATQTVADLKELKVAPREMCTQFIHLFPKGQHIISLEHT